MSPMSATYGVRTVLYQTIKGAPAVGVSDASKLIVKPSGTHPRGDDIAERGQGS